MKRSCLHLVNKAAVSLLLLLYVTDFYECGIILIIHAVS